MAGFFGPILLGLGQGISVSAGFGSFGFSVLLDGLYASFHTPFWFSQLVLTLCLFLLAWQWARIPLGLGSIPTLLLIGPAISLGATLTPQDFLFVGNLAAFITGLLFFSLGISLAAAAALGPDGVTALSLAAEKRIQWSVPRSTFMWNGMAITIGTGLGGNLGIASLAGLVCVPVLIHWMLPHLRLLMTANQQFAAGR